MAVPKKRSSKSRKRLRRGHLGFTAKNLVKCPNCGSLHENHYVCAHCGYYAGRLYPQKKFAPLLGSALV